MLEWWFRGRCYFADSALLSFPEQMESLQS